jgi:hypothetical protein
VNLRDTKSGDQNEYVSLQLELANVRPDTIVETTLKFLIYDQLFGKHHEQQGTLGNYSSKIVQVLQPSIWCMYHLNAFMRCPSLKTI